MRSSEVGEEGTTATDEKIEQMAALAWSIRAQEVFCERADVLIEEGVPNEEVGDILLGSSPSRHRPAPAHRGG